MKTVRQDLERLFRIKASTYTVQQCNVAIRDIDATLAMLRDKYIDHPYVAKLWLERDIMIERKYSLT